MKVAPPDFSKDCRLTVAQRIDELSVVDEIDEMLLDGVSCGDVAKFIQLGLEELEDVSPQYLAIALKKRRDSMVTTVPSTPEDEMRLAAVVPTEGRVPAKIARSKYRMATKGMDRLIELESLYLAQRDRLGAIITKEQELGFPFEVTDRVVMAAAKLLELHGQQEKDLLERLGDGPAHEKLDLKGYTKETAETLRKPDSRRRVVSIVERLRRVKGGVSIPQLPEASGE